MIVNKIFYFLRSFLCLALFFSLNPLCAAAQWDSQAVIVIFGATGDLTARKIMPAIYNLRQEGHLSENTVIVGIGKREYTDLTFRAQMRAGIDQFSRMQTTEALWSAFENQLFYHRMHFDSDEGYEDLREILLNIDEEFGTRGNRLFYLATPSSAFSKIIEKLHTHQLIDDSGKGSRVVIEKPFGHDLNSAMDLQTQISAYLEENQVYLIDHYLGKIGVQNLFALRFENGLLEPLWNHQHIDHIQITMSEEIGIGARARFWE
jgi:glucose-6-phosphate 1-dehydrogenase